MNGNVNSSAKSNKSKSSGKFNLIDVLLIVMVLIIVASLIYVFLPTSWIRSILADDKVDIQYTIEIQGVDEAFLENISENDIVLDSVSKGTIGTVTAIDYSTPYTQLEYNETTQSGVLSVVPEKYNMLITISVNADYTEGEGYAVNGTRIAVGELMNLRFPNFTAEGYCISVPTR